MSFGGGSSGPSPAQMQAQATQARLAAAQEKELAQQETERQASARARAGRMGGRSLLMMDETGFFTDRETGLQKRLGSEWRTPQAPAASNSNDRPGGSMLGGAFTSWLTKAAA